MTSLQKGPSAAMGSRAETLSLSAGCRTGGCPPTRTPVHTWVTLGEASATIQTRLCTVQNVPACLSSSAAPCSVSGQAASSAIPPKSHPAQLQRLQKCLRVFLCIIPGSRNWKGKLCSPAGSTPAETRTKGERDRPSPQNNVFGA